jgi:diguanylate cyclase (GGDEF)-like protein/PAS domain S-box-containing protein
MAVPKDGDQQRAMPATNEGHRNLRGIATVVTAAALAWSALVAGSVYLGQGRETGPGARVAAGLGDAVRTILEAPVTTTAGHAVLWAAGLGLIGAGGVRARRRARACMAENARRRLVAQAFDESSEAMVITDTAGRITAVNRAFTEITGYAADEVVGQDPRFLRSGRHDAAFYDRLQAALAGEGGWRGEVWQRRKNGEVFPATLAISALRDGEERTGHHIGIFSDISRQKRDADRIRFLACYDGLTGLPNRTLLADRVAKAIARARREGTRIALLFLDLDGFKRTSDALGHVIGDTLLRRIGERLKETVRDADTLARFGGDEFVLLLSELDDVGHAAIAAQRCLGALATPLRVESQEITVTLSIGISTYPDDGDTFDALLRNADTAMYNAKEAGGNAYRFFTAGMDARAASRAVIGNRLRRALEQHELELHYQPQADLATGEIIGVEALARWHHPELGVVPPAEFIPIAEETGLIGALGSWVLKEACRQAIEWQRAGLPHVAIAVNVSALQLRSPDFLGAVQQALRESGLEAHWLEIELTESVLMHEAESTLSTLRSLGALGIRIAVDDFGTGYSSLAYLRRLPIDKLKIDRSFVRDLGAETDASVIVSTIVRMAHSLKLKVLAEGVESSEQVTLLRAQGCDEMQGYWLARPLPADAFAEYFRERHAA